MYHTGEGLSLPGEGEQPLRGAQDRSASLRIYVKETMTRAACHATPVPVPLVNKAASPTGAHSPGHIAPTLYASPRPRCASHQDHLPLRQRSAHAPVPGAASRSAAEGQALTQEPCGITLRAVPGGSQESKGTDAGRAVPLTVAGRLQPGEAAQGGSESRPQEPAGWRSHRYRQERQRAAKPP